MFSRSSFSSRAFDKHMNLVMAKCVELRQRRDPQDRTSMITESRDIGN